MNALKIAAIGMAVLVVSVGAAAATPGNAPSGTPAGEQANNASEDSSMNASDNASAAEDGAVVGDRGPPSSLPAPVPDFVGEIHDSIRAFLNGTVDDLGKMVSDIAGGDHPDDAANESATNTTTTTA